MPFDPFRPSAVQYRIAAAFASLALGGGAKLREIALT